MKINLAQVMKNMETGEPLLTGQKGEPILLRSICITALNYPEDKLSGEDKMSRYALALRMRGVDEVDLQAKEVALIKQLIALQFPNPQISGQAWLMIEPPVSDA